MMRKDWISLDDVPDDQLRCILQAILDHLELVIVREEWQDTPHYIYKLEEPEP